MPQMILALAILTPYTSLHSQSTNAFNGFALIDQSGNIGKPADCRDQYELLRTYPIIHPKGIRSTWHMLPEGRPYYRKAGKFRDGAVLVKEIFLTDHAKLTTADAQWASRIVQWFGWALFKADAPEKHVATDYKKDCLSCHVPAKSTDWTCVQGIRPA